MIEKALSLIFPLITALVVFYLGSKSSFMKRTTDQRVIDLDAAQKLRVMIELEDNDENRLTKERYAKLLLRNENATFEDLLLLIKSKNIDYWGVRYFKIKNFLNIVYDEPKSEIVLLTYDTPVLRMYLLAVTYVVCAMIAAIPYIFSGWFFRLVKSSQDENSYFSVSIISVLCIFMALSSIFSLINAIREKSAKEFVTLFYERGIHKIY